jgi:hypothetical protein
LVIGACLGFGAWDLVLGIWNLLFLNIEQKGDQPVAPTSSFTFFLPYADSLHPILALLK